MKCMFYVAWGAALLVAGPVLAKQAQVDCTELRRAVKASRAAYDVYEKPDSKPSSVIATFSGSPKLGGFAILREGHQKDWCELAFKGTDITDVEDVLLDLAALIPAQCGRRGKEALGVCAAGFFIQYLSIRNTNKLFDALSRLRANGKCTKGLLVTGHSLGGALASIFAADAVTQDPATYTKDTMKLVTFAEPRVFGVRSAKRFHRLVKKERVINFGDKVAAVPTPELGFSHFGRPLFLHESLLGIRDGRLAIKEEKIDFAPEHAGLMTVLYHTLASYEIRLALCRQ